jgi:Dehydrogenases with different specificities (related to short-chain alcohol dehydrogenases)
MNMPDLAAPMARPTYYPNVLAGQVALVTGANSGIGKAVAIGLGKAGADVIVNYVADELSAEAVAQEIEAAGNRAIAIKADVSKEAEVQAMFAKLSNGSARSIFWSTTPAFSATWHSTR